MRIVFLVSSAGDRVSEITGSGVPAHVLALLGRDHSAIGYGLALIGQQEQMRVGHGVAHGI